MWQWIKTTARLSCSYLSSKSKSKIKSKSKSKNNLGRAMWQWIKTTARLSCSYLSSKSKIKSKKGTWVRMVTDRYHRQIQFPDWGEKGQARLRLAKVVQVGCGGLGSMLAQGMVRAGVGKLTIIDPDVVDITNLHRQFLFDEKDVREKAHKALAAEKKLRKINAEVTVTGIAEAFSPTNAHSLLSGHDLVLDGTDNMESRYAINDWCVRNNVPWIYGGVIGATGMLMPVLPGKGPCLRCLYPEAELSDKHVPSADETGTISTIPAFIALLQVTEAIKLLIRSPDMLQALIVADIWTGTYHQVSVEKDVQCRCCGKHVLPCKCFPRQAFGNEGG